MSDKQATGHRFKVGQTVKCSPSMFEKRVPGETFKIIRQLPIEGASIPYRIKSMVDDQERVVEEIQLTE